MALDTLTDRPMAALDPVSARAPIIVVDHVVKEFGQPPAVARALDDVSLTIVDNELFTLLGPSGCGKTTLLRILAGFEHPTAGQVRLDGTDIAGLPPHRRPVNTMFQSYALFPHLTVARNVAFGLEMLRQDRAVIARRVEEMLALVHLSQFADRKPAQLSGGQQQRVALARALAPKPRVLLLDEPLSALDLKLRKAMQVEIKRLQRETAITFVLVTHDQEEALALSDRVAVMDRGRVLQIGAPQAIYDEPSTCFVADFIGEANLVPGPLIGEPVGVICAVRPERVSLDQAVPGGRGLRGTVVEATFLGADTLVTVDVGTERPVRARLRGAWPREPGTPASVAWSRDAERLLPA